MTTATALTNAGGTAEVSFELVDPPGISNWFVNFSDYREREFKGKPHILNADDSLVLVRMAVFTEDGGLSFDYFVYKAGPGKPSLDLIPDPYPKIYDVKQIGILAFGDDREHYAVVFPAPRLKASMTHEMHIFSSESQAWSTEVAKVVIDRETGCHDMVRHRSSKVVSAGGSWLAWIDLWRGVLLCNVLDKDPVLKLLQWPVAPPEDVCIEMYAARSIRDATMSNGVVMFVEVSFDANADACWGWTATIWRREVGSEYWYKCFKTDIADILANDSSFSHLLRNLWDDDVNKKGLNKIFSAPPTLSLSSKDVVYFMTKLRTEDADALLISLNVREVKLEAIEEIPYCLTYTPCNFTRIDQGRLGIPCNLSSI